MIQAQIEDDSSSRTLALHLPHRPHGNPAQRDKRPLAWINMLPIGEVDRWVLSASMTSTRGATAALDFVSPA